MYSAPGTPFRFFSFKSEVDSGFEKVFLQNEKGPDRTGPLQRFPAASTYPIARTRRTPSIARRAANASSATTPSTSISV